MYPDPVAGMMGCAALLIALHHRQRTGEGQFIDLALQEPSVYFIGEQVLEYSMTGQQPERWGNRDCWHAPHGTYRCSGEDRWVSIAVRSQTEWEQLCAVIDQPWTRDARFAAPDGRRTHAAALDAQLGAWTHAQKADDVMTRLQTKGVPAAAVFTPWTVSENPQLLARDFFETLDHPDAGTHRYAGIPWKMSRTPGRMRMAAPGLGQHNEAILQGELGLPPKTVQDLTARGITGRTPPRKK